MKHLQTLADIREITALLSTRAHASDDHDPERMIDCHTEDGTDDHGHGVVTAREFISDMAATRYVDPDNGPQKHALGNVLVEFLSDDEAIVESYHLAYHRQGMTGVQTDDVIGGRYIDVFKKVDDRWKIHNRTVVYDWGRGIEATDPPYQHRPATGRESFGQNAHREGLDMDEQLLAELADKQAITEVLYTRARASDRRDHELALSCYHEGATETHEGYRTTARDFVLNKSLYAPGKEAPSHSLMHMITNVLIDFKAADEAFVESYHLCLMSGAVDGEERDTMIGGRYLDTFKNIDGRWAIQHREVVFDWSRNEPGVRRFWDAYPNPAAISFGTLGEDDPIYAYTRRGVSASSGE